MNNKTLFSNIHLLPGCSSWVFRDGEIVKKEKYFKADVWENQPVLEKERYYTKLRETFLRILPRYFSPDEPIGMSLTGGLDTRMIMSCIGCRPGEIALLHFRRDVPGLLRREGGAKNRSGKSPAPRGLDRGR